MKVCLALLLFSALAFAQDATELEAQYATCEKHHIPSDKCTPEIYRQLKEKDNAPLDPKVETVLSAAKEYRSRLKNPESMQLRTAYLTDEGAVCLEIGGQNAVGGMTVSRVVYVTSEWKGARRLREHWLDENGITGSNDRWPGVCQKTKAFGGGGDLKPGVELTDKVNLALKR